MRPDRIEHMRSYFAASNHDVNASFFAESVLRTHKARIRRQLEDVGFVPASQLSVLDITLGNPANALGPPAIAHVQGGAWMAKCPDCGGCEYVDFDQPVMMCCSCWNGSLGGAWRHVRLPKANIRAAVEAVLLMRPDEKTRSWFAHEKVADLVRENEEHGVARGVSSRAMKAADTAAGAVEL